MDRQAPYCFVQMQKRYKKSRPPIKKVFSLCELFKYYSYFKNTGIRFSETQLTPIEQLLIFPKKRRNTGSGLTPLSFILPKRLTCIFL
jgi:hypothetical protein